MQLSGRLVQQITDALLEAYASVDDLRMMVRFELNESVARIAGGENLRVLVFNIVTWAEQTGRIDDLIQGARRQNPGNPALESLADLWHAATLEPSSSVRTSLSPRSLELSRPVSIDIFLCYSRANRNEMHIVRDILRTDYISVWTDEGLEPGVASWRAAIEEAVAQAQAMVVLLSPEAKASQWVNNEVAYAQELGKRIFPVLLIGDSAHSVPVSLINVQRVDGRDRLIECIKHDLLPALLRHSRHLEVETELAQTRGQEPLTTTRDFARVRVMTNPPAVTIYGLDFSPYIEDQDPNVNPAVTEVQVSERLSIVAPYTKWIRTFGVGTGLKVTGRLAHEMGLKAAVGAWLSKDLYANSEELARLVAVCNAGEAEIAIVGSEVLHRNDLPPAQLVAYINQVRAAVPLSVLVTTADAFDKLLANPSVIAASDVIFGNYYPYWTGLHLSHGITETAGIKVVQDVTFSQALAALDDWYSQTVAAAGGKQVWISETGWPSCGATIGQAVPSPENAAAYLRDFTAWANSKRVPYLYFDAFDESWKAAIEGTQGVCWGVWDKDGVLKPLMAPIFDGAAFKDTWSGAPSIGVLHVPPYGTPIGSQDRLIGHAWHVDPNCYKVVVYILVDEGWWTKPWFAKPYTPIQVDGSWATDIATGGVDDTARQLAAFLVPAKMNPPTLSGAPSLPRELKGCPRVDVYRVGRN